MKLSTDRILTTHAGSLPRPEELVKLTYAQEEGKPVDHDVMAAAQARAVEQVVRRQAEAGIDVVSDGEMSKPGFTNYLTARVTGYEGRAAPWVLEDLAGFPDLAREQYGGQAGAHIVMRNCTGDIRYVGQDAVAADVAALSTAMSGTGVAEGFLPATSPGCFALAAPNLHYDSYENYLFALARALREEYRAIVESGLLLQIDCPDLPMAAHTSSWDNTAKRIGYQEYLELHVAALNQAVAGLPPDRMRMHICWGNYQGPHHMDVALTKVLPAVFQARPAAISFEAANPRHEHEWEDLGTLTVPDDKVLIPGVIDVKTNVLEHPHLIAQRIGRFAGIAGRERVIAGTDCGFGTFVGFGAINDTVAWLKLSALGQGARLASERLWR
jgi:5-methyltetrahydropteroyltriglutamate--homocysteine methyltransferase